jgi:hypothetical protein
MYSDFVTLVEKMANESTTGGVEKLFRDNYTKKWIKNITSKGWTLPSFEVYTQQLIDSLPVTDLSTAGWLQDIKMILHLYRLDGGLTWLNFVDNLLTSTSSVNKTQTLGSDVNGWCKGKTWVINTSTVTPIQSSRTPSYNIWKDNILPWKRLLAESTKQLAIIVPYVGYSTSLTRENALCNSLIPSRFSVVLGGVASGVSPLPVAASGVLKELKLSYKGKTSWIPWLGDIDATAPGKGICEPQPQAHLSLISTVACSSAFLGGLPSTEVGSIVAAELKG